METFGPTEFEIGTQHNTLNIHGNQFINHPYNTSPPKTLTDALKGIDYYHKSETHGSRGSCHVKTRETILEILQNWRDSKERAPVCWLYGSAGVGKSAIALTVANEWGKDGGPGIITSFFFGGQRVTRPPSLLWAIALGLTDKIPELRRSIEKRIDENNLVLSNAYQHQFEDLVFQPLKGYRRKPWDRFRDRFRGLSRIFSRSHTSNIHPNIVIIDGLDSSCHADGTYEDWENVLTKLLSTCQKPCHFPLRFLILSRPEPWIRRVFDSSHLPVKRVEMNHSDFQEASKQDIETYFSAGFDKVRSLYFGPAGKNIWKPSAEDMGCLLDNANEQFLYAAVVQKFIGQSGGHPGSRLRTVLNPQNSTQTDIPRSLFHDLDEVYRGILNPTKRKDRDILQVLSSILLLADLAEHPLACPNFIEILLPLDGAGQLRGQVYVDLATMHSVFNIPSDPNMNISPWHKSFTDFLLDPSERAGDFFIQKSHQRVVLAEKWVAALTRLRSELENLPHNLGTAPVRWLLEWPHFFFHEGQIHEGLSSALNDLYYTMLSTFSDQDRDMLLCNLCAVILVPSVTPHFIKLLLQGTSAEAVYLRLRSLRLIREVSRNQEGAQVSVIHQSFTEFLRDESLSKDFCITGCGSQTDFLARRWLSILKSHEASTSTNSPFDFPYTHWWDQWAGFCCLRVQDPSNELLINLRTLDLSTFFLSANTWERSIINPDVTVPAVEEAKLHQPHWCKIFRCLETASAWLKANPDAHRIPLTAFDGTQKKFDILLHEDPDFPYVQDFVTWILLHIAECTQETTMKKRLKEALRTNVNSYDFAASAVFCECPESVPLEVVTRIPDEHGRYRFHINMEAGYVKIATELLNDLQSSVDSALSEAIASNLVESSLLELCGPQPEFLPRFEAILPSTWALLELASARSPHGLEDRRGKRLLVWLNSFPDQHSERIAALKDIIFTEDV